MKGLLVQLCMGLAMDTIMIEHLMRGMLDYDLIEETHDRMIDQTGTS